jgi:O-antigen ligase
LRTIALWLSLVLIFMVPWEDIVDFPGLGTLVKFIGLVLVAFWVATVVIRGRFRKPSPFHLAAGLYVLWNAASVFWSVDADQTIDRVVTFAQLLALAFILWDLLTTRAALLAGLEMYILGAYVAVGNTLINYFSGSTFYWERFSAAGTNPDDLGAVLALGIPVAWYLAISESTSKKGGLLKLVNYAYIPAAFLGIALSGTRSALIGVLPGMAFGLASLTRLRLAARIGLLLLLIAAGFILLPLIPQASLQRLGTTGTELTGGDLNGRIEIWRDGLASFAEHPFIGVGSNMFRSVTSVHVVSHSVLGRGFTGVGKVAHNSFLSVLVEVGLIGFALFGIMITIAVIQAWGQPKWDASFWLAVLATWAISAFTLTWEFRKPTWLFLSLVIVSAALTTQRQVVTPLVRPNKPEAQVMPATKHTKGRELAGRKKTVYVE